MKESTPFPLYNLNTMQDSAICRPAGQACSSPDLQVYRLHCLALCSSHTKENLYPFSLRASFFRKFSDHARLYILLACRRRNGISCGVSSTVQDSATCQSPILCKTVQDSAKTVQLANPQRSAGQCNLPTLNTVQDYVTCVFAGGGWMARSFGVSGTRVGKIVQMLPRRARQCHTHAFSVALVNSVT